MGKKGEYVISDKQTEWAMEKYRAGYGMGEIGAALHCDKATVYRAFLRKYGGIRKAKCELPKLEYNLQ